MNKGRLGKIVLCLALLIATALLFTACKFKEETAESKFFVNDNQLNELNKDKTTKDEAIDRVTDGISNLREYLDSSVVSSTGYYMGTEFNIDTQNPITLEGGNFRLKIQAYLFTYKYLDEEGNHIVKYWDEKEKDYYDEQAYDEDGKPTRTAVDAEEIHNEVIKQSDILIEWYEGRTNEMLIGLYFDGVNSNSDDPGNVLYLNIQGYKRSFDKFGDTVLYRQLIRLLMHLSVEKLLTAGNIQGDAGAGSIRTLLENAISDTYKMVLNPPVTSILFYNIPAGFIKDTITEFVNGIFKPFEDKLDPLTLKYLGFRFSTMGEVAITSVDSDMQFFTQKDPGKVREILTGAFLKFKGRASSRGKAFDYASDVTFEYGWAPPEDMRLDKDNYVPFENGKYEFVGNLYVPMINSNFDALIRTDVQRFDNARNNVFTEFRDIANGELMIGGYYRNERTYADISGMQYLYGWVDLNSLGFPKVYDEHLNLSEQLMRLFNGINKAIVRIVDGIISPKQNEKENKLLEYIIKKTSKTEKNPEGYNPVGKLFETPDDWAPYTYFTKNEKGVYVPVDTRAVTAPDPDTEYYKSDIFGKNSVTLTVDMELIKQTLEETGEGTYTTRDIINLLDSMLPYSMDQIAIMLGISSAEAMLDNSYLTLTLNVDTNEITVKLFTDVGVEEDEPSTMIFQLDVVPVIFGADVDIAELKFKNFKPLEKILTYSATMKGNFVFSASETPDLSKLLSAAMGENSGLNTPYRLKENAGLSFVLKYDQYVTEHEVEGVLRKPGRSAFELNVWLTNNYGGESDVSDYVPSGSQIIIRLLSDDVAFNNEVYRERRMDELGYVWVSIECVREGGVQKIPKLKIREDIFMNSMQAYMNKTGIKDDAAELGKTDVNLSITSILSALMKDSYVVMEPEQMEITSSNETLQSLFRVKGLIGNIRADAGFTHRVNVGAVKKDYNLYRVGAFKDMSGNSPYDTRLHSAVPVYFYPDFHVDGQGGGAYYNEEYNPLEYDWRVDRKTGVVQIYKKGGKRYILREPIEDSGFFKDERDDNNKDVTKVRFPFGPLEKDGIVIKDGANYYYDTYPDGTRPSERKPIDPDYVKISGGVTYIYYLGVGDKIFHEKGNRYYYYASDDAVVNGAKEYVFINPEVASKKFLFEYDEKSIEITKAAKTQYAPRINGSFMGEVRRYILRITTPNETERGKLIELSFDKYVMCGGLTEFEKGIAYYTKNDQGAYDVVKRRPGVGPRPGETYYRKDYYSSEDETHEEEIYNKQGLLDHTEKVPVVPIVLEPFEALPEKIEVNIQVGENLESGSLPVTFGLDWERLPEREKGYMCLADLTIAEGCMGEKTFPVRIIVTNREIKALKGDYVNVFLTEDDVVVTVPVVDSKTLDPIDYILAKNEYFTDASNFNPVRYSAEEYPGKFEKAEKEFIRRYFEKYAFCINFDATDSNLMRQEVNPRYIATQYSRESDSPETFDWQFDNFKGAPYTEDKISPDGGTLYLHTFFKGQAIALEIKVGERKFDYVRFGDDDPYDAEQKARENEGNPPDRQFTGRYVANYFDPKSYVIPSNPIFVFKDETGEEYEKRFDFEYVSGVDDAGNYVKTYFRLEWLNGEITNVGEKGSYYIDYSGEEVNRPFFIYKPERDENGNIIPETDENGNPKPERDLVIKTSNDTDITSTSINWSRLLGISRPERDKDGEIYSARTNLIAGNGFPTIQIRIKVECPKLKIAAALDGEGRRVTERDLKNGGEAFEPNGIKIGDNPAGYYLVDPLDAETRYIPDSAILLFTDNDETRTSSHRFTGIEWRAAFDRDADGRFTGEGRLINDSGEEILEEVLFFPEGAYKRSQTEPYVFTPAEGPIAEALDDRNRPISEYFIKRYTERFTYSADNPVPADFASGKLYTCLNGVYALVPRSEGWIEGVVYYKFLPAETIPDNFVPGTSHTPLAGGTYVPVTNDEPAPGEVYYRWTYERVAADTGKIRYKFIPGVENPFTTKIMARIGTAGSGYQYITLCVKVLSKDPRYVYFYSDVPREENPQEDDRLIKGTDKFNLEATYSEETNDETPAGNPVSTAFYAYYVDTFSGFPIPSHIRAYFGSGDSERYNDYPVVWRNARKDGSGAPSSPEVFPPNSVVNLATEIGTGDVRVKIYLSVILMNRNVKDIAMPGSNDISKYYVEVNNDANERIQIGELMKYDPVTGKLSLFYTAGGGRYYVKIDEGKSAGTDRPDEKRFGKILLYDKKTDEEPAKAYYPYDFVKRIYSSLNVLFYGDELFETVPGANYSECMIRLGDGNLHKIRDVADAEYKDDPVAGDTVKIKLASDASYPELNPDGSIEVYKEDGNLLETIPLINLCMNLAYDFLNEEEINDETGRLEKIYLNEYRDKYRKPEHEGEWTKYKKAEIDNLEGIFDINYLLNRGTVPAAGRYEIGLGRGPDSYDVPVESIFAGGFELPDNLKSSVIAPFPYDDGGFAIYGARDSEGKLKTVRDSKGNLMVAEGYILGKEFVKDNTTEDKRCVVTDAYGHSFERKYGPGAVILERWYVEECSDWISEGAWIPSNSSEKPIKPGDFITSIPPEIIYSDNEGSITVSGLTPEGFRFRQEIKITPVGTFVFNAGTSADKLKIINGVVNIDKIYDSVPLANNLGDRERIPKRLVITVTSGARERILTVNNVEWTINEHWYGDREKVGGIVVGTGELDRLDYRGVGEYLMAKTEILGWQDKEGVWRDRLPAELKIKIASSEVTELLWRPGAPDLDTTVLAENGKRVFCVDVDAFNDADSSALDGTEFILPTKFKTRIRENGPEYVFDGVTYEYADKTIERVPYTIEGIDNDVLTENGFAPTEDNAINLKADLGLGQVLDIRVRFYDKTIKSITPVLSLDDAEIRRGIIVSLADETEAQKAELLKRFNRTRIERNIENMYAVFGELKDEETEINGDDVSGSDIQPSDIEEALRSLISGITEKQGAPDIAETTVGRQAFSRDSCWNFALTKLESAVDEFVGEYVEKIRNSGDKVGKIEEFVKLVNKKALSDAIGDYLKIELKKVFLADINTLGACELGNAIYYKNILRGAFDCDFVIRELRRIKAYRDCGMYDNDRVVAAGKAVFEQAAAAAARIARGKAKIAAENEEIWETVDKIFKIRLGIEGQSGNYSAIPNGDVDYYMTNCFDGSKAEMRENMEIMLDKAMDFRLINSDGTYSASDNGEYIISEELGNLRPLLVSQSIEAFAGFYLTVDAIRRNLGVSADISGNVARILERSISSYVDNIRRESQIVSAAERARSLNGDPNYYIIDPYNDYICVPSLVRLNFDEDKGGFSHVISVNWGDGGMKISDVRYSGNKSNAVPGYVRAFGECYDADSGNNYLNEVLNAIRTEIGAESKNWEQIKVDKGVDCETAEILEGRLLAEFLTEPQFREACGISGDSATAEDKERAVKELYVRYLAGKAVSAKDADFLQARAIDKQKFEFDFNRRVFFEQTSSVADKNTAARQNFSLVVKILDRTVSPADLAVLTRDDDVVGLKKYSVENPFETSVADIPHRIRVGRPGEDGEFDFYDVRWANNVRISPEGNIPSDVSLDGAFEIKGYIKDRARGQEVTIKLCVDEWEFAGIYRRIEGAGTEPVPNNPDYNDYVPMNPVHFFFNESLKYSAEDDYLLRFNRYTCVLDENGNITERRKFDELEFRKFYPEDSVMLLDTTNDDDMDTVAARRNYILYWDEVVKNRVLEGKKTSGEEGDILVGNEKIGPFNVIRLMKRFSGNSVPEAGRYSYEGIYLEKVDASKFSIDELDDETEALYREIKDSLLGKPGDATIVTDIKGTLPRTGRIEFRNNNINFTEITAPDNDGNARESLTVRYLWNRTYEDAISALETFIRAEKNYFDVEDSAVRSLAIAILTDTGRSPRAEEELLDLAAAYELRRELSLKDVEFDRLTEAERAVYERRARLNAEQLLMIDERPITGGRSDEIDYLKGGMSGTRRVTVLIKMGSSAAPRKIDMTVRIVYSDFTPIKYYDSDKREISGVSSPEELPEKLYIGVRTAYWENGNRVEGVNGNAYIGLSDLGYKMLHIRNKENREGDILEGGLRLVEVTDITYEENSSGGGRRSKSFRIDGIKYTSDLINIPVTSQGGGS